MNNIDITNIIIPSIDLLDGNIVRLYKGDYGNKTVYNIPIAELLDKYKNFKTLHIVDLNGAKGDTQSNIPIVKEIRSQYKGLLQFGGGVRSINTATHLISNLGIDRIVIGTLAITDYNATKSIINKINSDKVTIAIDCEITNNKVIPKINGWTKTDPRQKDLFDTLGNYKDLAKHILCTDIACDGTMTGPNVDLYKMINKQFPQTFLLQASGGVSSINDVNNLSSECSGVIIGKALYSGIFDNLI